MKNRPRSRGTVRLASADPKAAPLIDPNYWADPGARRRRDELHGRRQRPENQHRAIQSARIPGHMRRAISKNNRLPTAMPTGQRMKA